MSVFGQNFENVENENNPPPLDKRLTVLSDREIIVCLTEYGNTIGNIFYIEVLLFKNIY